MTLSGLLVDQLRRTREWTCKLLLDISGADWFYQPKPGLQHPLWLCGHLVCSQEVLLYQRCFGKAVLAAEFASHFPMGGPIQSADQHDWPAVETVLLTMNQFQLQVEETVGGLSADFLDQPAFGKDGVKHPHYDTKAGAISHMVRHEAFHAGQLALLRRMLDKPFLR